VCVIPIWWCPMMLSFLYIMWSQNKYFYVIPIWWFFII
jgi:hypothetical protein